MYIFSNFDNIIVNYSCPKESGNEFILAFYKFCISLSMNKEQKLSEVLCICKLFYRCYSWLVRLNSNQNISFVNGGCQLFTSDHKFISPQKSSVEEIFALIQPGLETRARASSRVSPFSWMPPESSCSCNRFFLSGILFDQHKLRTEKQNKDFFRARDEEINCSARGQGFRTTLFVFCQERDTFSFCIVHPEASPSFKALP